MIVVEACEKINNRETAVAIYDGKKLEKNLPSPNAIIETATVSTGRIDASYGFVPNMCAAELMSQVMCNLLR
jgi:hypothetical protein